jgi:predicted metal-dependent peptidase
MDEIKSESTEEVSDVGLPDAIEQTPLEKVQEAVEHYKKSQEEMIEALKRVPRSLSLSVLEKALFAMRMRHPFYGTMLQQLRIELSIHVQTMGVGISPRDREFVLTINPIFLVEQLETLDQRVAVLVHEAEHLTRLHLIRGSFKQASEIKDSKDAPKELKDLLHKENIAMDISINQDIPNLPEMAMQIDKFKHIDPTKTLEKSMTWEYYFENIDWDQAAKDFKANGQGMETIDDHGLWDSLSEEERARMTQELMKRTIEKGSFTHSSTPGHIMDLLRELEVKLEALDTRKLLEKVIKKSLPSADRRNSWNKRSKRFGYIAPGTQEKLAPKIEFWVDSSGSIGHIELNQMLAVVDDILRHTEKTAKIGFFHTDTYGFKKYKRGGGVSPEDIQTGGTELTPVFKSILETRPDLGIILTDGYFSDIELKKCPTEVIFIITKQGTTDHPLVRLGKTVKMG